MKKIIFMLLVMISSFIHAQPNLKTVADYSFDATEFKGTPEMLFNKGIMVFENVDSSVLNKNLNTSGWAAELNKLNILPMRYNPNNGALEVYTWNNGVPAQRVFRERVKSCNEDDLVNYCDFHFNNMFFDFINENEGIIYYRYIAEDRFAYFYFDENLELETRQQYQDRITKEILGG